LRVSFNPYYVWKNPQLFKFGRWPFITKRKLKSLRYRSLHLKFLKSICGVLFFGVPSRGMDITTLIPMVRGRPNNALLQSIGSRSSLKERSRRFRHVFKGEKSRIVDFYETEYLPTAQWVSFSICIATCVAYFIKIFINRRFQA
jgi:hypothetical protein